MSLKNQRKERVDTGLDDVKPRLTAITQQCRKGVFSNHDRDRATSSKLLAY